MAMHRPSDAAGATAGLPGKDLAAAVGQRQGHRVEYMDGRTYVGGGVGGVQPAHQLGAKPVALYHGRAQRQPGGQQHVTGERRSHACK